MNSSDNQGGRPLSPGQVDRLADLVREAFEPDAARMNVRDALEPNELEQGSYGRFESLELIGSGGFGHVYRAFDPRHSRYVALKIPYRRLVIDPGMMRRFRVEAEAAGKLDHPGVVPLFEVGEADGRPYIASAYAPGLNLSEWRRRLSSEKRAMPPRAAASIALALARAMATAHDVGVIHRDLKPSNIILQPADGPADVEIDGKWFRARIIDFGLAKFAETKSDLTRTDFHIGTPHYMAPEQFTRRFGPISPLTDVYGLGATLYTALAGREPFAGDEQLDLFGKILVDKPTALTKAPFRIPADLAAICHCCLEKSPVDRYPSMKALAADLERFLVGRRVTAGPSRVARMIRGAMSRRAVNAMALAMLTAAIGLLAGTEFRRALLDKALAADRAQSLAAEKRELDYLTAVPEAFANIEACNTRKVESFLTRFATAADLHAVEWRLLLRSARAAAWSVQTDSAEVHSTAVSSDPSNAVVFCGLRDGRIQARSAKDGTLLRTMRGHRGSVNWMTFLDDGATLASCGEDGSIRTWDARSGELRRSIAAHSDWIAVGRVTPDRRRLVTCGGDKKIRFWRLPALTPDGAIAAHADCVRDISFSDDGKYLVSCGEDKKQLLWDVGTRSLVAQLPHCVGGSFPTTRWARHIQFLGGGPPYRAAASFFHGQVVVYRFTKPDDVVVERELNCRVLRSARDAKENRLFMTRSDGAISAIDLESTSTEAEVVGRGHASRPFAIALDVSGSHMATGDRSGELRLWDLRRDPLGWSSRKVKGSAGFLDRNHAFIAGEKGRIAVHRAADGELVFADEPGADCGPPVSLGANVWRQCGKEWRGVGAGPGKPPTLPPGFAFNPAESAGGLYPSFWDQKRRRIVVLAPNLTAVAGVVEGLEQRLGSIQVSSDGQYLAGELDRKIRLYRLGDKAQEISLESVEGRGEFVSCSFSPDGRQLVLVKDDRSVTVWATATGERIAAVCGRRPLASAVVANGRRIVAIDNHGQLYIWDLKYGAFLGTLLLAADVNDANLELSPHGDRLLVLVAVGQKAFNQMKVLDIGDQK